MHIPVEYCFLVFIVLLLASMVMQWLKAKRRQRLVRAADPALMAAEFRNQWAAIDRSFDFMFKDFRKLQVLKKSLGCFPEDIREHWERYRRFSRAEITVTVFMLVFAATAFLVCGS